jgi:hypothetical protein
VHFFAKMVQITRFLTVLSVAAAGLALTVKRDAATVEADIARISTQVTTLDNAIEAYPLTGGTLLNALTIHTDATTRKFYRLHQDRQR